MLHRFVGTTQTQNIIDRGIGFHMVKPTRQASQFSISDRLQRSTRGGLMVATASPCLREFNLLVYFGWRYSNVLSIIFAPPGGAAKSFGPSAPWPRTDRARASLLNDADIESFLVPEVLSIQLWGTERDSRRIWADCFRQLFPLASQAHLVWATL